MLFPRNLGLYDRCNSIISDNGKRSQVEPLFENFNEDYISLIRAQERGKREEEERTDEQQIPRPRTKPKSVKNPSGERQEE